MFVNATGEIPKYINFQEKPMNEKREPLTGRYNFKFELYPFEIGGSPVWLQESTIDMMNGLSFTELAVGGVSFDRPYLASD